VLGATLVVLALGAIEGWFGKTDRGDVYGSDAIQYLDCARAIGRGDWTSALNPLWSQGYPALLAWVRPLFAPGPWGDWLNTRSVNFLIVCLSWAGFCWMLREILSERTAAALTRRALSLAFTGSAMVFVVTQLTLGQVSRVGPDQLVAALFFMVCALLLRLQRRPGYLEGVGLGLILGGGFLVKAVFLPLGAVALLIVLVTLGRSSLGRLRYGLPAALLFGCVTLGYGAMLSRAVGYWTLGDAGSLNYAWHVNRLAKWVHWEGGVEAADKAWPKPSIARFTHWQTEPPDFGQPLHPSLIVGVSPKIFVFHAPAQATYVPYYDPPYWYQGYRHVVRWRYQIVALAKSAGDLAQVLLTHPLILLLWIGFAGGLLANPEARRRVIEHARAYAGIRLLSLIGIAIFLPVHLEGRYLSGALAVLSTVLIVALAGPPPLVRGRMPAAVFASTFFLSLVWSQHAVWARAVQGWSPRTNPEWQAGIALRAAGLPPGAQIGAISWQPNLECDWAYIAGVRITSEIASGQDETAFYALPPARQRDVLARFHEAGAAAVLTWDKPPATSPGWRQLSGAPMWIYRF
jgi:hypothetical protein